MDMYGFYTGQAFDAHEYLGAHMAEGGVVFRTFAPNAKSVSLLLEGAEKPMQRAYDGNFYELTVADAKVGQRYEYRIYLQNGGYQDHCDPYGFSMELRPEHRSVVCDLRAYAFADGKWMKKRTNCLEAPLNIYELHLGSWRRGKNGEVLSYTEMTKQLIPYLKESGFNYIEILPISEHPCDESWGYQNTGFFAPTSRYGAPHDLMAMIDLLHQHDIGVILDFVPVHFAIDPYALAQYDGTALYEYPHSAVGISEWGSYNFMHSRGEVRSFLQSSANYWLGYYHFDGLRMDAVSRILYWQGDENRGENSNAIAFLRNMNAGLKQRHSGIMLIAEDSSNYHGITQPTEQGGLGFDYKWDMGWMHDTLEYFQTPPYLRPMHYHKLTFSMLYFQKERYLLPLSHDEVVHGKATVVQKISGEYADKFPQARAMYLYMAVHPGKKLNFMGSELGQLREWDEKREQDWALRSYPLHDSFCRFFCKLNETYLSCPALYGWDYREAGFSWIDCHQEPKCVYAISRCCETEELVALFNFSGAQQRYTLPAKYAQGRMELLLYTDWEPYGGQTPVNKNIQEGEAFALERFSGVLLKVRA